MSAIAEGKMAKDYMKRKRLQTYIACEDFDFTWDRTEVARFRELWRSGVSIVDIAEELGRHQVEVGILAFDQAELTRINPRVGGMLGTEYRNGGETE